MFTQLVHVSKLVYNAVLIDDVDINISICKHVYIISEDTQLAPGALI